MSPKYVEFTCESCGCHIISPYIEDYMRIELAGDIKIELCLICGSHYKGLSKYDQREYVRAILDNKRRKRNEVEL